MADSRIDRPKRTDDLTIEQQIQVINGRLTTARNTYIGGNLSDPKSYQQTLEGLLGELHQLHDLEQKKFNLGNLRAYNATIIVIQNLQNSLT